MSITHLGCLERILKLGLVSDSFSLFTGLIFSCGQITGLTQTFLITG